MKDSPTRALPSGTLLRGKVYTYRIEKVLGQGSFGITYLASTQIPGPLGEVTVQVALKEFFAKDLDSRMSDGTVTARTVEGVAHRYARAFLRESDNLSKMKHPGIVNVLESFEAKGTCYYSMEYLSGGTLDEKVRGVGLPEVEALPLIAKIGEALSYMHDRKMMHLDLKPNNIMLKSDGTPVIIDFGLSKQYDTNGEPESSTTIGLGTPGYAPIEQANQTSGRIFQPTIDIYALGATLYKMLTGSTPPTASDILNEGFPEDKLKEKQVSPATLNAVRKAMSAAKKDRPQTIEAFLSLLGANPEVTIVDPEPHPKPKPTPKPQPPKPTPEKQKSKTWLWTLLGAAAVATIIAAIVLGGRKDKPVPPDPLSPTDSLAFVASVTDTTILGSVKLSSTPSGATIWLDGKNTKKTTPEIIEDLTPGKHNIKLTLDGYSDYTRSLTITSGKRSEVSLSLTAKVESGTAVAPSFPASTTSTVKPTRGSINGHEYVDLGLSVKWATCNVGASSPSDYGKYYAWGETSPKSEYNWVNYKFRVSGDSYANVTFVKYNTQNDRGTVDNKRRLDLSDDAASQNWGGSWRMPTDAEWTELRERCTWTWTTQGGKNGYKVTSKTNGNSIFLPAAGYRNEGNLNLAGSNGLYWSSSLSSDNSNNAWNVSFNSGGFNRFSNIRYYGFSVRPVSE